MGIIGNRNFIDALMKDGAAAFKQTIAGSSYTGAATPIMWTGMIGPHTGVRDPFHMVQPTLLQEYFKDDGLDHPRLHEPERGRFGNRYEFRF